jgi:hypothetical protein
MVANAAINAGVVVGSDDAGFHITSSDVKASQASERAVRIIELMLDGVQKIPTERGDRPASELLYEAVRGACKGRRFHLDIQAALDESTPDAVDDSLCVTSDHLLRGIRGLMKAGPQDSPEVRLWLREACLEIYRRQMWRPEGLLLD